MIIYFQYSFVYHFFDISYKFNLNIFFKKKLWLFTFDHLSLLSMFIFCPFFAIYYTCCCLIRLFVSVTMRFSGISLATQDIFHENFTLSYFRPSFMTFRLYFMPLLLYLYTCCQLIQHTISICQYKLRVIKTFCWFYHNINLTNSLLIEPVLFTRLHRDWMELLTEILTGLYVCAP